MTETTIEKVTEYWSGHKGVQRIHPPGCGTLGIGDIVRFQILCQGDVCDVGCGVGRLAQWVSEDRYVGVDINPEAIRQARDSMPDRDFRLINWGDALPEANTYVFWTVLLHVPDGQLDRMLSSVPVPEQGCTQRVVLYESMDRSLRSSEFNFQRSVEEYELAFGKRYWRMTLHDRVPLIWRPWFVDWMVLERKFE